MPAQTPPSRPATGNRMSRRVVAFPTRAPHWGQTVASGSSSLPHCTHVMWRLSFHYYARRERVVPFRTRAGRFGWTSAVAERSSVEPLETIRVQHVDIDTVENLRRRQPRHKRRQGHAAVHHGHVDVAPRVGKADHREFVL